MDARERVLPNFGVSRLVWFERTEGDIGLHISESFTSDTGIQKAGQDVHICAEETYNGRPQASISQSGDLAAAKGEERRS